MKFIVIKVNRWKKIKGTERRKGQEQETTKMVKKKWGERRKKKKLTSVFVLLENAQSSVASYLFPFTFYSSTFSYISPLFSSLEHFIFLCHRHLTHRCHMSVRIWGYDHFTLIFPRLFSSLIYVTEDFINHLFYHGRPVSWSMTQKYHFSEASDGELLIA